MAQISIIQKSNINQAGRFDAEYFKPEYLEVEKILSKNKTKPLSFFIKDGYRVVYENTKIITDFQRNHQKTVSFLQANDIGGYFLNDKLQKVKYSDWENYPKGRIKKGEILIEVKGNAEKITLVPDDYPLDVLVTGSLYKFMPVNISGEFLLIWLTCKYGENLKSKLKRNLMVHFIGKDDLHNIPVPIVANLFQQQIEQTVKQAYAKQTQSKTLYQQAEQLLLTELGLVDFKLKHQPTFSTTKGEVEQAERFDAEYFQPKYKQIMNRIENYIGGFALVKNVLDFNKTNFFPEENEFYNYIPLSKVSNIGEIEVPEKELGKNLPTRARRKIKQGEIILSSISGSLETSAIIGEEHNNFIASNGFYVFSSQKINPETLLILFKSKIMLEILQKISKGAILGGYDLTAFEKLTIPLIKPDIQNQIAQKITLSHQLRKQSKDLLEQAKKSVEVEIENQASQH